MIKKNRNLNAGFTYVELIVVMSIFSVMTSIVLFNYQKFQDGVDVKVLANDIAMKIVEAQKASLSGKMPPSIKNIAVSPVTSWKPSYGVFFFPNTNPDASAGVPFNKEFIYFTDLNQDGNYPFASFCPNLSANEECLDKIKITKNNSIDKIDTCVTSTGFCTPLSSAGVLFKRPDSGAIFVVNNTPQTPPLIFDYIKITVKSASGVYGYIKVYPSGRVQIS